MKNLTLDFKELMETSYILTYCNCNIIYICLFLEPDYNVEHILLSYRIIGLYTTFVLVASKFLRGFFAGISYLIMFDDMPNVDRIFQLCLDVYLVRESGELDLEEDLFAKLIFLYRSPETLIKWTRPKTERSAGAILDNQGENPSS